MTLGRHHLLPALPVSYGDIAPSHGVTRRFYFNLKQPARFALSLSLSLQNASGVKLSTSYTVAIFAPAP